MEKLTIYLFTDTPFTKIPKMHTDRVTFIVDNIKKPRWAVHNEVFMLPERSWVDDRTKHVLITQGKNVDGVMFVLSDWKNGKKKINGLQPGYVSNTYDTMFVKGDNPDVAFHELKHSLDNLIRVHLGISIEKLLGIADWDDVVVHDPAHRYDFLWRLESVWGFVSEVVRQRRKYEKLNSLMKLLESLKITFNSLMLEKRKEYVTEVAKTNGEKLHESALSMLGTDASPNDTAPDELGCADSVSSVIMTVLTDFKRQVSTLELYKQIRGDKRFEAVGEPEEGAVLISPTGKGNGSMVGHTGICGKDNIIMSNDSLSGKFMENYTTETWRKRYMEKGGFPMAYFRLK